MHPTAFSTLETYLAVAFASLALLRDCLRGNQSPRSLFYQLLLAWTQLYFLGMQIVLSLHAGSKYWSSSSEPVKLMFAGESKGVEVLMLLALSFRYARKVADHWRRLEAAR